jgi:hypothetical protein
MSTAGYTRPSALLLAGGAALLVLALCVAWFAAAEARAPAAPLEAGRSTAQAPARDEPRGALLPDPDTRTTADAAARETPAAPQEDLRLRAAGPKKPDVRFEGGRGRIRGYIETSDATPFPREWSLVLEPSRTLAGRDRAERRELFFHAGEQEFAVEDLPLAGYDLVAKAAGLNALPAPVLLERANRDPYVTLQFYPAGFVAGRLLDAAGLAADGVRVTLVDEARGMSSERSTDLSGRFRFDGVLDGEYTLSVGSPIVPLFPAERLRFHAPSLTLPDRTLPDLGALRITLVDAEGRALPGALLRGAGPPGGEFEATTDALGEALVRYLPPGHYRVTAEDELLGHTRRATTLKAKEQGELTLRFQDPR